MDQRIADQVGQRAPNCGLDPLHCHGAFAGLLEGELDPGVQRRGAEIREDVQRHSSQIDRSLFDDVIL